MDNLEKKVIEKFKSDEVKEIIESLNTHKFEGSDSDLLKTAIIELSNGELKIFKFLLKKSKRKQEEILNSYRKKIKYESTANNIWIDKDKFIEWVDFDATDSNVMQIDGLIKPIDNLFDKLETCCDRECCGIHAFDFSPNSIKSVKVDNPEKIDLIISNIISELESCSFRVFTSLKLNQLFHKSVFIKLLKHIKTNI